MKIMTKFYPHRVLFLFCVLNIWNPTAILINEHSCFKIQLFQHENKYLSIEYNILAQPIVRNYKLFQNILRTVLYNLSGFQIPFDTQLAVRTWQATMPLHL